jgi:hypothetical protein
MPHMATTRTHRKWSANEKVCAFVFAMIGSILSVTFQRQTCHRLPVYTSSSSTRPPKKQPLIEDEADLDSSRVAPSSSTSWHGRYMPRMKMTENRSCNCEERHREKHDWSLPSCCRFVEKSGCGVAQSKRFVEKKGSFCSEIVDWDLDLAGDCLNL